MNIRKVIMAEAFLLVVKYILDFILYKYYEVHIVAPGFFQMLGIVAIAMISAPFLPYERIKRLRNQIFRFLFIMNTGTPSKPSWPAENRSLKIMRVAFWLTSIAFFVTSIICMQLLFSWTFGFSFLIGLRALDLSLMVVLPFS